MLIKILNLRYILIFLWLIFFGSLGAKWKYETLNLSSINEVLNLLRFLCFFTIPPIFYLYFKFIKNFKFNNDLILKCFYIIFIFQLVGFVNFYYFNQSLYVEKLLDKNLISSGYNLRFSYSFYIAFSSILPLPLICLLTNRLNLSHQILNLSIIILTILTTVFLTKIIYDFYQYDKIYFYHLGFLTWGKILDVAAPRATGISKWLLILYTFSLTYLFFNDKHSKLILTLTILLGVCIYLLQSRTSIYFFIFVTFFLFFKDKKFLLNSFKILVIFSSIFFISNFITEYKHRSIVENVKIELLSLENKLLTIEDKIESGNISESNELKSEFEKLLERKELIEANKEPSRVLGDKDNFSTGRTQIWATLSRYIFKTNFQNMLLGYGPQSDRYLSGQNASSGIFYILITSGLLGFVLYIAIYFRIFYLFFKIFKSRNIIFKSKLNKNKLQNLFFSIFILIYLMSRSLVEISFISFGVDFLFFMICFINLSNFVKFFENIQSRIH